MHNHAKSDNHIQQDGLVDNNHKILVLPGEYSCLHLSAEKKAHANDFYKGRSQNVDQKGPQQSGERRSAHIHSNCRRIVLRRL